MIRRTLLLLALFFVAISTFSKEKTIDEARKEAASFMLEKGIDATGSVKLKSAPKKLASTLLGAASYYVFNASDGDGFVVISGDDRIDAILGYSQHGYYDEADAPANFKAWMQMYEEEIALLDKKESSVSSSLKVPTHSAIAPMVEAHWGQSGPYNNQCPVYNGNKAVTGCLATAIAQIMHYNQWPEEMTSYVPSYITNTYKIKMDTLKPTTFDWSKMEVRGTDNSGEIAKLMLYCGQSVKMDYTPFSSGAASVYLSNALVNYFNYSNNCRYLSRTSYTTNDWDSLIYNEIANNRPVLYCGQAKDVGHAFVCDGYDGNGLYHINWGWNGSYDGYFRLSVLNPNGTGIGGSSTNGGFSMSQDVVVGIEKPHGSEANSKYLVSYSMYSYNDILMANVYNYNLGDYFYYGWGEKNDDGTISNPMGVNTNAVYFGLLSGYNTYYIELNKVNLSAGTHRIVPISRSKGSSVWRSTVSDNDYFEVVVNDLNKVERIVQHPLYSLHVDSVEYYGSFLPNTQHSVLIKLSNNGEEYNGRLYLFASKNEILTAKDEAVDYAGIAIEQNSKDSLVLYFTPSSVGKYNIWITTDSYGQNVIGRSEMTVVAPPSGENVLDMTDYKESITDDKAVLTIDVLNKSSDVYTKPLSLWLFKSTDGEDYEFYNIYEQTKNINPNATQSFTFDIDDLQMDCSYRAVFMYYALNTMTTPSKQLATKTFESNKTAIESVIADGNEKTGYYYSLQGVKIKKPTEKGIYIRNGKTIIIK